MNPEIFKAYDVRGIYPEDIDKDAAFKIGRALVVLLNKNGKKKKKKKMIVGRDNRLSSPVLSKAFKDGIKKEGVDIIDIGLTTSPMFYFAAVHFKADGGAMVTASHNPKEYNGLKLIKEKSANIGKGEGMEEIKKIVEKEEFTKNKKVGKEKKAKIISEYIKFNFNFINKKDVKPLKIVIDTANASSSPLVPYLAREFKNIKFYHIFSKLDGNFPGHQPDPTLKENRKVLVKEVKKRKADFGVAFDGDADRMVFVDERGESVGGDLITALMAKIVLKKKKGAKILADLTSSRTVEEITKENGGQFYSSRIGHSFVKPKMKKNNIDFGGEKSAHYYLGKNNSLETPLFTLFKVIEEISKQNIPLSKIMLPFERYIHSGEMNFKKINREGILKEIKKYCRDKKYKILTTDGIKIEGKDFWCLVRPSNTEPLLRFSVEARNKNDLQQRINEFKKIIDAYK